MDNEKIVENLEVLLGAVEAHPEELFELEQYTRSGGCGTIFCTAGLATTLPHFNQQGLTMVDHDDNAPSPGFDGSSNWRDHISQSPNTDKLFGHAAFLFLFSVRDLSPLDCSVVIQGTPGMSDKQVAIARIKSRLTWYRAYSKEQQ